MKRILSIMLVLLALSSSSTLAAGGLIDECIPDYQRLIFDVAIEKAEDLTFYASVDGNEMVEVEASPYPADSVGHIIVVDLAWGWTSHVDEASVIRPILNDYLNRLDRSNLVKFIIANPNGTTFQQQYMSVAQASSYVNNSLALPEKETGKPMSTSIATAIQSAYKEAATLDEAGPAFKSVFALVDPANPSFGDSATSIRDEYRRTGNSFPVSIATVYVESYMENYGSTETAKRVRAGLQFYNKFANDNGTVLVRLNHRQGEVIKTDGIAAALSPRKYYRMNLNPLHPLIDYSRDDHEIVIEGRTYRGSVEQTVFGNIRTKMLPAALYTPTPEITPEPIITPEPPIVGLNDNKIEAKKAILRLQQLYYLDGNKTFKGFDEECQYAFLNFCRINGIEEQDVIFSYAYDLLLSDQAMPYPTPVPEATPTPEPVITPVPKPTVPPEGYRLGDTDANDSTFIAQMQTILQALNLYASEKVVGQLDQATMDAVILYCQQYGMALNSSFHIDKSIVTEILTNGGNRAPYTPPAPAFSEQLAAFLQRDALLLGSFQVKMWMLMALVVVLIFIIILICILSYNKGDNSFPDGKKRNGNKKEQSSSDRLPSVTDVDTPPERGTQPYNQRITHREETQPLDDDRDKTQPLGSGISVTFTIDGGPSQGVVHAVIGSKVYFIGRESSEPNKKSDLILTGDDSISRQHVAINYYNGQLFIRDNSSNGTSVNGNPLNAKRDNLDDATRPLNAASSQNSGAYALHRGDVIKICRYRITINW